MLIPDAANLLTTSGSNPATNAAIVGRSMNATGGITILRMRQMMRINTITKPITASFVDGAAAVFLALLSFAGFSMSVKVLYSSLAIFWYSSAFAKPGLSSYPPRSRKACHASDFVASSIAFERASIAS